VLFVFLLLLKQKHVAAVARDVSNFEAAPIAGP